MSRVTHPQVAHPQMFAQARFLKTCILLVSSAAWSYGASAADHGWRPISRAELEITSVPQAPNAAAICLLYDVYTDDVEGHEHTYVRIKVLTEEGRDQGNVEIPFIKGAREIKDFKARTVAPDGSAAEFTGTPIDKTLIRARGFEELAKTFALPNVQAGTIVEYQYDFRWDKRRVFSQDWFVSGALFTVRAVFTRRPSPYLPLHGFGSRLPKAVDLQKGPDGLIHMELNDLPASPVEDFMPPEAESRPLVRFYYGGPWFRSQAEFWPVGAKAAREGIDHFISDKFEVARVVGAVVKPTDLPEIQLQKLYAKVQALRNLSFEQDKTRQVEKRENLKEAQDASEVLKHGYGWRQDLDWLYFALVRQAGFQAWPLLLARRDGPTFFDPRGMSVADLPGRAVLVQVNGHDYFLDPGTPSLPFGLLRWGETSVKALRLDLTNGGFIDTPMPAAANSAVERKATLHLDEAGTLEGDVTIVYSGLEAFNRRFDALDLDDLARRRMLEAELQKWIFGNATVELKNPPVWTGSEPNLTAIFSVRIPNWALLAGHRMFCSEGVFSGAERDLFPSEQRTHDLYFPFSSETRDEILIVLPEHFHVDSIPAKQTRDLGFLSFATSVTASDNNIQISRRVTLGRISLPVSIYAGVRAFYQSLRSADESQTALRGSTTSSAQ